MNERIRLLAEQATKQVTKPDGHYIVQEWQRVFAELIVRECMEQVWYTREDYINENISEVIKERIKEHFGVEE